MSSFEAYLIAISDHSLRFVTTRDEESMARSSDDVFLEDEESESFKQQVEVCFPTSYHQQSFEAKSICFVVDIEPLSSPSILW